MAVLPFRKEGLYHKDLFIWNVFSDLCGRCQGFMRKRICFLSFLLLAVCLNAGCASGKREDGQTKAESSLFAMNTYMAFTAYGVGGKDALKDSEQMLKEV